jgi:hypothetical protein
MLAAAVPLQPARISLAVSAAAHPWAVLAAGLHQSLHNACVDLQQQL